MSIKAYIASLCAAVLLVGCTDTESPSQAENLSPTSVTEAVTTTAPAAETAASTTTMRQKKPKLITVDVISYDGEKLTYEYEGGQSTVTLERSAFSDHSYGSKEKTVSEKIINNRFGLPVKADIRLSEDKAAVEYCNVFDKNVIEINFSTLHELGGNKGSAPLTECVCYLKRIEGSIYELGNKFYKLAIDLNELDNSMKADFGDYSDSIYFSGYLFNDGANDKVIPGYIGEAIIHEGDEVSSESRGNADLYRFFGTVQSVKDGRASVLLTDGKTACDVPTYYNDGEVKEGADVMIVLDADTSLFGSGEEYKSDYAVFYTDPKSILLKKHRDISTLAYALIDPDNSRNLIVTTVEELEAAAGE